MTSNFTARQQSAYILATLSIMSVGPLIAGEPNVERFPLRATSIVDGLRIRSTPMLSGLQVDSLSRGEPVMTISVSTSSEIINGKENRWYRAVTERAKVGWVFGAYLAVPKVDLDERSENARIAAASSLVKREGNKLLLSLSNRGTIDFIDENPSRSGEGGSASFAFERVLEGANAYLVSWSDNWEVGGHILVDKRTGERIQIGGEPVFSPNGKRIVSVDYSPTADDYSHIWIGRIDEGKIFPEFTNSSYFGGLSAGVWLNKSTIAFLGQSDNARDIILCRKMATEWAVEKLPLE